MAGDNRKPAAGVGGADVAEQRESAPSPALDELLLRLESEPWRFHLYAAMRALEAAYPGRPRFARSVRLRDDPVRFGQEPSLAFAPSTVASFRRTGPAPRLDTFFFGLFGPHGPLPLHLTEYARQRERNARDATFRRFADVFHHRMLQLFYRSWANSAPVAQADRPADDRYAFYVGALEGFALESLRHRGAVADEAQLFWAGLFSMSSRPAEGLERILAGFFGVPVQVEPCIGHWIDLPPTMQTPLGSAECRLGQGAMVGDRVWDCAGKFRVVVGPVSYASFERFLPGGPGIGKLTALIRSWSNDEHWWDLQVVLKQAEVPGTRLNARSGLGWNTWLLGGPASHDAHDYIVDPIALAS
jgi:type VI secretion system protein ImpH